MKIFKIILLVLLAAFVGIQFVPTTRNESNNVLASDFMNVYDVPKEIKTKIRVSCYDCHSNNTKYPWYNKVQPMAWILENHIEEGKSELNFSEFGSYSGRRKKSKLKSIVSQIEDGEMPLTSYTLIHGDTKLSEADKKQVVEWVNKVIDSL